MDINPIIKMDFPDPDVIRVGDTYYMATTTMYFMPGCQILRSYDLLNWEHASYVYEALDSTPAQRLAGGQHIYGQGMWAASLRYHKGKFYVCFVANDTKQTYLYVSDEIEGPWEKRHIEGFYHDCSLLFDDDGRVFIVYGNRRIWLTELRGDLSGPLEDGLHRIIVSDDDNPRLGYEGAHFYKINGKYFLFLIHSKAERWMRTQACFTADSPEGDFAGGDILEDDRGYCGQGVAQGGIVDTPEGDWYSILFQDSGAAGRIPVLVPLTWENGFPHLGVGGKIPKCFPLKSTRPGYVYKSLYGDDDFSGGQLRAYWQYNHEPDRDFCAAGQGFYEIRSNKLCANLCGAQNTITQRMLYPVCSGEVTVDGSGLAEGDYAGLCALQSCYGMVAMTKREGKLHAVTMRRESGKLPQGSPHNDLEPGIEQEILPLDSDRLRVKISVDFTNMRDEAVFYIKNGESFTQIGSWHKLYFRLDHFTGCRFGLFLYSTKQTGGWARFQDFRYLTP